MTKVLPRIGLGTYTILDDTASIIYKAIQCGYRHMDCARIYKNEYAIGLGLQQAFKEKLVERKDLWVTSKVWNDMHRKEDVKRSCLETLKDLQLEYLDLYLIHWPIATDSSGNLARVPLSETWKAMESLVDEGLVKHIGVSNFDIQLLNDLLTYCRIRPLVNQVECHIYLKQKPLLNYCAQEKIYLTCYSPLARSGDHSKKHVPIPGEDLELKSIAQKHKKTIAQVMLKWALQRNPYTVIIPKSKSINRLQENIQLDFTLTEEDMQRIDKIPNYGRIIITPGPIEVFT